MNKVFGKKVGMTSLFNEKGQKVPVTVLEVFPTRVMQIKTDKTDGYRALVVGFGGIKEKKIRSPQAGLFKKINCAPVRYLRETCADDAAAFQVGQELNLAAFGTASIVDVSAVSKGKGFAGTIKRHHFMRGRETHGNKNHREPGSIGNHSDPAKVWKGKKMAGQMGNVHRTVKNLQVVKIMVDKNLLLVKGSVPGANNSLVDITKTNGGK
ncbi:MAG: 50S ribosomal protein L3 [Fibrobacterota bacterium]